jgi:WhiB family transcriptional regulator, redox-sensing transcriptional regulator
VTAPGGKGRGAARVAQWRKQAVPIWRAPAWVACRGEDTSLFYKGESESTVARDARLRKARAICGACPARAECLEAAMAEEKGGGGRYGVRGGYTPEERKALQVSRTLKARSERRRAEKAAGKAA